MAATFNPNLADDISRVRYLIGDTDVAANVVDLDDATITFELTDKGTVKKAAASCAWALVAKYSKLADVTIDDQLTRYSKAHDQYLALATRLQAQADAETVAPLPGNTTRAYANVIVTGLDDNRGPLDCCNPSTRFPC